MTDILERLRTKYCCTTEGCNCDEAADTIERLQAENEALRHEVERWRRAAALKAAGDAIRGLLDIAPDDNLDSEQAGRAYAALHDIDTALKGQSK